MPASDWSVQAMKPSDWSLQVILPSDWSIHVMSASDWSIQVMTASDWSATHRSGVLVLPGDHPGVPQHPQVTGPGQRGGAHGVKLPPQAENRRK